MHFNRFPHSCICSCSSCCCTSSWLNLSRWPVWLSLHKNSSLNLSLMVSSSRMSELEIWGGCIWAPQWCEGVCLENTEEHPAVGAWMMDGGESVVRRWAWPNWLPATSVPACSLSTFTLSCTVLAESDTVHLCSCAGSAALVLVRMLQFVQMKNQILKRAFLWACITWLVFPQCCVLSSFFSRNSLGDLSSWICTHAGDTFAFTVILNVATKSTSFPSSLAKKIVQHQWICACTHKHF